MMLMISNKASMKIKFVWFSLTCVKNFNFNDYLKELKTFRGLLTAIMAQNFNL